VMMSRRKAKEVKAMSSLSGDSVAVTHAIGQSRLCQKTTDCSEK